MAGVFSLVCRVPKLCIAGPGLNLHRRWQWDCAKTLETPWNRGEISDCKLLNLFHATALMCARTDQHLCCVFDLPKIRCRTSVYRYWFAQNTLLASFSTRTCFAPCTKALNKWVWDKSKSTILWLSKIESECVNCTYNCVYIMYCVTVSLSW